MPGDGSVGETIAGALLNIYDAYAWIVPALFLTLVFIAALVAFCWWVEDVPLDVPVVRIVRGIFRWSRRTCQMRTVLR